MEAPLDIFFGLPDIDYRVHRWFTKIGIHYFRPEKEHKKSSEKAGRPKPETSSAKKLKAPVHYNFLNENKREEMEDTTKTAAMKPQHHFKIVVLEDNEFYNNLLTKQLQNYTGDIAFDKDCTFDIESYTNANDCIRNLKPETDVAFVDYYLGENKNALDILKKIKEKCNNCKVIVISQVKNMKTLYQTRKEGAYNFICKRDRYALIRSCFMVEDIINERLWPQAGA